ncbi:alpha/beta hydrolase [Shewanella sp. Isolate13]|uniref:alpha/beta fold hydrolase n=1 Tax=Shewanella sp. Isolate13 TaxID=2908531 RepID=UPI001EFDFE45|nr:alpha/beta fold hydrolase [Shewanella sp. Isolate13]MCG9728802.1 alpha/beta hydrolase [Shewanella sp. Isolate13]
MNIQQKSLYIPYNHGHLHLRQITPVHADMSKPPVLMLHGAMSNGRVFYSDSGKGLGCYLADSGVVVYVLDTLGRGLSEPKLARGFKAGQGEVIREQLPLIQQYILSLHPKVERVHWCAHSWGGVLMASAIARYSSLQGTVASLVTFGSKRRIEVKSVKKWLSVDLIWNKVAPIIAWRSGYLPADKLKIGMDNESRASLRQSIDWVRGKWIDSDDGFDYQQAASRANWPKSWFIAAKGDTVLGNPSDVKRMIAECQIKQVDYTLLSKKQGFKHDYDHGGMLTHKDAVNDHFPRVRDWYHNFNG